MRSFFCITLFLVTCFAEVPVQHGLNRYSTLWRESPFTIKPVVEMDNRPNELNNFVLLGVSSNPLGGHTVTIVDKRDRTKRKRIHSSGSYTQSDSRGYRILEIARKGLNYKETRVRLSYGEHVAWIGYDDQVLAVKPQPALKPARVPPTQRRKTIPAVNPTNPAVPATGTPLPPGLPPGLNLNTSEQPSANPPTTRRPRIRRIVKPKQ